MSYKNTSLLAVFCIYASGRVNSTRNCAFDLEAMEPVCSKCFPGNMLDFTGILPGYEGITYRKEKCTGTDKWLYSYRDSSKAAMEESDWLYRTKNPPAFLPGNPKILLSSVDFCYINRGDFVWFTLKCVS